MIVPRFFGFVGGTNSERILGYRFLYINNLAMLISFIKI